jgi:8-oxo-dGTP pyrophosphatase MutT (NUDIX family)
MRKGVAKVLLINNEGKALILNRNLLHPNFPGHMDLPGGTVGDIVPGEMSSEAAVREVKEEVNLLISKEYLKLGFEINYDHVTHVLYVVKDIVFDEQEIKLSHEHNSYSFMDVKTLVNSKLPLGVDDYWRDVINYITKLKGVF